MLADIEVAFFLVVFPVLAALIARGGMRLKVGYAFGAGAGAFLLAAVLEDTAPPLGSFLGTLGGGGIALVVAGCTGWRCPHCRFRIAKNVLRCPKCQGAGGAERG
jgi:hypothetical protein